MGVLEGEVEVQGIGVQRMRGVLLLGRMLGIGSGSDGVE